MIVNNNKKNVVKPSHVRKITTTTTTPTDPIDYYGLKEGVDFVYVDFDNLDDNDIQNKNSK
jgi:hypothetical protein